ncbi:MAG: response regulator [Caulobacteraceae bacterium]
MWHLLIIEDELLVALDLGLMLLDRGATSFAFLETELEAVQLARINAPDIILSDVRLRHGTGPAAVQAILSELGQRPVILITGTPEECKPCDPPHRVFSKPIHEPTIAAVFREMAPL